MRVDIVVRLVEVRRGKNSNWLEFKAYCGFFSDSLYTIDFSGIDIDTTIPLTDEKLKELKEMLVQDFGYAPYDMIVINDIIEKDDGKAYILKK